MAVLITASFRWEASHTHEHTCACIYVFSSTAVGQRDRKEPTCADWQGLYPGRASKLRPAPSAELHAVWARLGEGAKDLQGLIAWFATDETGPGMCGAAATLCRQGLEIVAHFHLAGELACRQNQLSISCWLWGGTGHRAERGTHNGIPSWPQQFFPAPPQGLLVTVNGNPVDYHTIHPSLPLENGPAKPDLYSTPCYRWEPSEESAGEEPSTGATVVSVAYWLFLLLFAQITCHFSTDTEPSCWTCLSTGSN